MPAPIDFGPASPEWTPPVSADPTTHRSPNTVNGHHHSRCFRPRCVAITPSSDHFAQLRQEALRKVAPERSPGHNAGMKMRCARRWLQ